MHGVLLVFRVALPVLFCFWKAYGSDFSDKVISDAVQERGEKWLENEALHGFGLHLVLRYSAKPNARGGSLKNWTGGRDVVQACCQPGRKRESRNERSCSSSMHLDRDPRGGAPPVRPQCGGATGTEKKAEVFYLNSYHDGYAWSDRLLEGIRDVLDQSGYAIEFQMEYMDLKKYPYDSMAPKLYELYKHKYANDHFDIVIISAQQRPELHPGVWRQAVPRGAHGLLRHKRL